MCWLSLMVISLNHPFLELDLSIKGTDEYLFILKTDFERGSDFMHSRTKGIMCILLSGLGFSVMNLLIPLAGPLPTLQKMFFRNLVAFIVALWMVVQSHKQRPLKELTDPKQIPWSILSLRVIFGTLGIFCNYYALDNLLISDASVLNKLAPFATLIFSSIFLKEKLSKAHIAALCLALVGVIFVTKPSLSSPHMLPYIVGMVGGFMAGGAYTCVRALTQKGVSSPIIILAFSAFSCIVCIPWLITHGVSMSLSSSLALIGVGLAASVGQLGITYAYQFAPASEISIFDYSTIVFTGVLGIIFLHQIPDIYSVLGYVIIFTAGLLTFLYNRRVLRLVKHESH